MCDINLARPASRHTSDWRSESEARQLSLSRRRAGSGGHVCWEEVAVVHSTSSHGSPKTISVRSRMPFLGRLCSWSILSPFPAFSGGSSSGGKHINPNPQHPSHSAPAPPRTRMAGRVCCTTQSKSNERASSLQCRSQPKIGARTAPRRQQGRWEQLLCFGEASPVRC